MTRQSTDRPVDFYRWYVLALAALTHTLVVAMPTMSLPVLFAEISQDLHLDLVQIGVVWGLTALTGIVTSLVGGVVGDRLGAKRALVIACLLTGLTGILRGLANDYVTLALTVLVAGIFPMMIPTNVHKTCGIWFGGKRLGLANGIVSAGMALGFMLGSALGATVLSPWLGGWRNVIYFYGFIAILVGLAWSVTQAQPHGAAGGKHGVGIPFGQALAHVARQRNVWVLGLAMLAVGGCLNGALGYIPLYLRNAGWAAPLADNALAAFHGASLLVAIPFALLSDRLGNRRTPLMVAVLMIGLGTGLLSLVDGVLVWVAVVLAGMVRDGFMAVLMTFTIELPGVGATYAGTASGVVLALSRVGGVIAPPLGNSLAQVDPGLPFVLWGGMALLGFVGFWMINDVGMRKTRN